MRARHLLLAPSLRRPTPARPVSLSPRLRAGLLALALGTTSAFLAERGALAEESSGNSPGAASVSRSSAAPAADQDAPSLRLDAPARYTIQAGDTLWGLASRFLKDPWRWPELWTANKDTVKNPDRLSPGQVLLLDRGSAALSVESGTLGANGTAAALPTERLSPGTREAAVDATAIPAIPTSAIDPFLAQVHLTEGNRVPGAQPVSGIEDGRAAAYASQHIYAGALGSAVVGSEWNIARLGPPLVDPETRRTLATEVVTIGLARLVRTGETATLVIVRSDREVVTGDFLIARDDAPLVLDYMPHAPAGPIAAQVITIYGGRGERSSLGAGLDLARRGALDFERRREAGPLQVIVLNRGSAQGLEPGHVLSLHSTQTLANDRSTGPFYQGARRPPPVQLPSERYGLAMVFRTFDKIAYALVVQGIHSVKPGDMLREP
jgi:hypothetical protein